MTGGSGVDPCAWWEMLAANVILFLFYCVKSVFACSAGEGLMTPFIYLCVTTPSVGHAPVDEILLLLPTFLISVFLSSAVRSSVTHHLCKFRSFS